jgi:hypothetical protein
VKKSPGKSSRRLKELLKRSDGHMIGGYRLDLSGKETDTGASSCDGP